MDVELRLSEVMAALSHALDISDGHPAGHATRTCLIGMRVADEIDLDPADRSALFYGLLLKDLGCSSNAARLSSLYGADDHVAKRNAKTDRPDAPARGPRPTSSGTRAASATSCACSRPAPRPCGR